MNRTFTPVTIAQADHPKCGASSTSQFGYCPDDNTVYYSSAFARKAYYSLTDKTIDQNNGNVTLQDNQPADFALGTLFAVGWGMAVLHQLFAKTIDGAGALLSRRLLCRRVREEHQRRTLVRPRRSSCSPRPTWTRRPRR